MRRTLAVLALVAAALAAPASAGLGVFTGFAKAPECGFRQLCFDIGLSRGALIAAALVDRLQLWANVTYIQDGRQVATQTVNVPLPRKAPDPRVAIRGTVVIPQKLAGKLTIKATAAFGFVLQSRTGDRAFFIDETGVIRATETVPPCDDTDSDPTNDCPGALEN